MKVRKTYQQITSEDIFQVYELLISEKLLYFPLTLENKVKIESIVFSINATYFNQQIYTTKEEKSVAYLYFLIKGHPFIDGNKRTASLVFQIFCDLNELNPIFDNFQLDELVVFIENIKESDHQKIIKKISNLLFKR